MKTPKKKFDIDPSGKHTKTNLDDPIANTNLNDEEDDFDSFDDLSGFDDPVTIDEEEEDY